MVASWVYFYYRMDRNSCKVRRQQGICLLWHENVHHLPSLSAAICLYGGNWFVCICATYTVSSWSLLSFLLTVWHLRSKGERQVCRHQQLRSSRSSRLIMQRELHEPEKTCMKPHVVKCKSSGTWKSKVLIADIKTSIVLLTSKILKVQFTLSVYLFISLFALFVKWRLHQMRDFQENLHVIVVFSLVKSVYRNLCDISKPYKSSFCGLQVSLE